MVGKLALAASGDSSSDWEELKKFLTTSSWGNSTPYTAKRKLQGLKLETALVCATHFDELLPHLDEIFSQNLPLFTAIYLYVHNVAELSLDSGSPEVGRKLWKKWFQTLAAYGQDLSSSNPCKLTTELLDLLHEQTRLSLRLMDNHREFQPKRATLLLVISLLSSCESGGWAKGDLVAKKTLDLAKLTSHVMRQDWAKVGMLPLEHFDALLRRVHTAFNSSRFISRLDTNSILNFVIDSLGRASSVPNETSASSDISSSSSGISSSSDASNTTASSSSVGITSQSHRSTSSTSISIPITQHSSSSSSQATSGLWSYKKEGQLVHLPQNVSDSLDKYCTARISVVGFKIEDQDYVAHLDLNPPAFSPLNSPGDLSTLIPPQRASVEVEIAPPVPSNAATSTDDSDDEDEDDVDDFEADDSIMPLSTAAIPLRLSKLLGVMIRPDPLKPELVQKIGDAVPRLVDPNDTRNSAQWVYFLMNLSTTKNNNEPQLELARFRASLRPLSNHFLSSPEVGDDSFRNLIDLLKREKPSILWIQLVIDLVSESGPGSGWEPRRLPQECLALIRARLTPDMAKDVITAAFKNSTLAERLQFLGQHTAVPWQHQNNRFPLSLRHVLDEYRYLFPDISYEGRMIDSLLDNEWDSKFPALRLAASACFKDFHTKLASRMFDVSPMEIHLCAFITKTAVMNQFSANGRLVDHQLFPTRFHELVSKCADPNSFDHIRPGIVSIMICHHTLSLLIQYANFEKEGGPHSKWSLARLIDPSMSKLIPFLQWYDSCLDSKEMQDIPHLKELLETAKPRFLDFKAALSNHFARIVKGTVTTDEIQSIRSCFDSVPRQPRLRDLGGYLKIDIGDLDEQSQVHYALVASISDRLGRISAITAWFEHCKVAFNEKMVTKPTNLDSMLVNQLQSINDQLDRQLKEAKLDANLMNILESCLIPERSEIFQQMFDIARKNIVGSIPPDQLSELIEKACLHLQLLFADTSPLSRLRELDNRVARMGHARFELELKQLSSIVASSQSNIKIEDIKTLLQNGAKLSQYTDAINYLNQFCSDLDALAHDIPALSSLVKTSGPFIARVKDCQDKLSKRDQLQVKDIAPTLKSVTDVVCGLQPHTLHYFEQLRKNDQLVRFLRRPDFHNKIGILTGQVQGMAFAAELLSNLVDVYGIIGPIYTEQPDIESLLREINTRIGALTPEQLQAKWRKFHLCQSNINEITTYFNGNVGDSAVAFLPTAIRALKFGRYVIRTSLHEDGSSIGLQQISPEGEVESTLEKHNLHGRLRSMTVFVDKASLKEDEIAALDQFKQCYRLAQEICAEYDKLTLSGHPVFQEEEFYLGEGKKDMTIEEYREHSQALLRASAKWTEKLEDCSKNSPRLLLLQPKSVSSALHVMFQFFAEVSYDVELTPHRLLAGLGPFISQAFPELCGPCLPAVPIPCELLISAFCNEKFHDLVDAREFSTDVTREELEDTYEDLLEHLADILKQLGASPIVQESLTTSQNGVPRVIRAGGMTPVEHWKVVIRACSGVPHPSQVLHCTRSTSLEDLDRFLQCTVHFSHLPFVVFGANLLSHQVRHRLLLWTSELGPKSGEYGELILLFTAERSGEDMFGFLSSETAVQGKTGPLPLEAATVLKARSINSLHCLHSIQGKTTTANTFLNRGANDIVLFVSIAESFDIKGVIELLRNVNDSNDPLVPVTIGFHLDIKPYADLSLVAQFLHEWLYFGLIRDPWSGDAFSCINKIVNYDKETGQVVQHEDEEPLGPTWNLVIELTDPPAGDESLSHLLPAKLDENVNAANLTPPILHYLPAVHHLSSSNRLPPPVLTITDEMRRLAGILRLYSGNTPFQPRETIGNGMQDAEARNILDQQWVHIRCLRQRSAIINRLSSLSLRLCRWTEYMTSNWSRYMFQTYQVSGQIEETASWAKRMTGAKEVFKMMIAEAEYLTSHEKKPVAVPLVISHEIPELPNLNKRLTDDEESVLLALTPWESVSFTEVGAQVAAASPLNIEYLHPRAALSLGDRRAQDMGRRNDPEFAGMLGRQELRKHMRMTVANALGLKNTSKMIRTLEQHRYVLTPNLAQKMLHIHARIHSGQNVILVGDTGQGKTEMVNFYALFLNMDSDAIPDLLESIWTLMVEFVNHMYRVPLNKIKDDIERTPKDEWTRAKLVQFFVRIATADIPEDPLIAAQARQLNALRQQAQNDNNLMLSMASQARLASPSAAPAAAAAAPSAADVQLPAPVAPYVPNRNKFPDLTQAKIAGGGIQNRTCCADLLATLDTWIHNMLAKYPLMDPSAALTRIFPDLARHADLADFEDLDSDEDDESASDDDREEEEDENNVGGLFEDQDDDEEDPLPKLENLMNAIMDCRVHSLFFKQLMHQGLTIDDMDSRIEEATLAAEKNPNLHVLFFIDESNTTSFMGRLKDLLVDGTWQDKPLPDNLTLVAAINPQTMDRSDEHLANDADGAVQARVDWSRTNTISNVVSNTSHFDVRLQHPSMEELVYYFSDMDEAADDEFWEAMIELGDTDICVEEQRTVIDYVLLGQKQIRRARIENMHPSIRDLVRAMKLFKYFRRSTFGSILIGEADLDNVSSRRASVEPKLDENGNPIPFTQHFWKALFMTIAVGYYFRLRNETKSTGAQPHPSTRLSLFQSLSAKYEQDPHHCEGVSFKPTVDRALQFLFDETDIPQAIAPTSALMENLFCTVICVDMKMPLTISGPAGCSKTLSFTIAVANMQGRGSPKPLYRLCAQMHHFRYQCSDMSTDVEIEATYKEAVSRQLGITNADANTHLREMCTVLLDESNLAENGSSQPLKAIHGKLDHPDVMTVILTNKLLDPAKTNRTLQVLQSTPTHDDLSKLARSCLVDKDMDASAARGEADTSEYVEAFVEGTRKAFVGLSNGSWNAAQAKDTKRTLHNALIRLESYQLRDFVYFLRTIRSTSLDRKTGQLKITSNNLLKAILRNFGGIMHTADHERLVKFVFEQINSELSQIGDPLKVPPLPSNPTEMLRESVMDTIAIHETNPNINSCRYILLLDPTNSCNSLDLLFDLNIVPRDNRIVISCPEFEEDASEDGVNERVMKMKDAMERGQTVVLVAADGIFGNFYDLFNKHFLVVPVDNPREGEPPVTFFSNVAVGSISRPCKVHPEFKVIVHLPMSRVAETPLPFLSRFEKYVLSFDQYLQEQRSTFGPKANTKVVGESQLDALIEGVTHFFDHIHQEMRGKHPFHGFVTQQTIVSLAMGALQSTPPGTILEPVVIPHFIADGAIDDSLTAPARSEVQASWIQYLVRMTNCRLLQIAKPDEVSQMKFLPKDYLKEYYLRQEHFSAANLVRSLVEKWDPTSAIAEKEDADVEEDNAPISAATSSSHAPSPSSKGLPLSSSSTSSPNSAAKKASAGAPKTSSQTDFRFCHKWVISTRNSSNLVRLHLDPMIQACLVGQKSVKSAMFISASSIASIAKFNEKLEEFFKTHKEILVITADMRNRSESQLNDLKWEVDNHLSAAMKDVDFSSKRSPLVFFLLHHPPEHSQSSHYAYPAIFWNDWDFYYTDSLGIWSAEDDAEGLEHVEEIAANDNGLKSSKRKNNTLRSDEDHLSTTMLSQVDARAWIAKAMGLDVQVSPESVQVRFRALFPHALDKVLAKLKLNPINGLGQKKGLHKKAMTIYRSGRCAAELKALFEAEPSLVDEILAQFANYWSNSLLNKIVKATCDDIRGGKATAGFIQLVRNSLQFMLVSVCKELVTALLSNLNLGAVLTMLDEARNEDTKQLADLKLGLVRLTLKLVSAPSLETIIAASELETQEALFGSAQWYVPMGKCVPTSLPMFDVLVRCISSTVSSAMRSAGISNISANMDAFIPAFDAELRRAGPLCDALRFIDSSQPLRERFYDDFVQHELELPHLPNELRHIVRVILDAQVGHLDDKIQISSACLFMIPSTFRHILSHVGLCLAPLASLHLRHSDVSSFGSSPGSDVADWSPQVVESKVHTFTIELLWSHLHRSITLPPSNDRANSNIEPLWQWFQAFRDLYIRITSARWLRACSSNSDLLSLYHRMVLLFETVRAYGLSKDELSEFVRLDRISGANDEQLSVLESKLLKSSHAALSKWSYIHDTVAQVRKIDLKDENDPAVVFLDAQTVHLIHSIIEGSIAFDPSIHTNVDTSKTLAANISLFAHIAAGVSPAARSNLTIPQDLLDLIEPQWILGQLLGLLSKFGENVDWRENLLTACDVAVRRANETYPNLYTDYVPYLSGELDLIAKGIATPNVPKRKCANLDSAAGRIHNRLSVMWMQIFTKEASTLSWDELARSYAALAGGNNGIKQVRRVSMSTLLLVRLAEALSSSASLNEAKQSWMTQDTIAWIKRELLGSSPDRIARVGLPADPVPFLFTQLKSTNSLKWLIAQKDLLESLGLEEWHVVQTDEDGALDSRYFRWMNLNQPQDIRFEMYREICNVLASHPREAGATELLKVINSFTVVPPPQQQAPGAANPAQQNPLLLYAPATAEEASNRVFSMRMVLFMAVFAKFMSKGIPCQVVTDNIATIDTPLSRALDLTAMEALAFKFISNGPRQNVAAEAYVESHFSAQSRDANNGTFGDNAILLAVNMASTLGMPRERNHLYPLTFAGHTLSFRGPLMVASTYRTHSDCGFKWDFDSPLQPADPPIMRNFTRHRLALNSSYWSAFTWSLLLDGPRVSTFAFNPQNHVLNQCAARTADAATNYSFDRAATFTMALDVQHPGDKANNGAPKRLDTISYTTECLTRMQYVLTGQGNGSSQISAGWKSSYLNQEDINAYHDTIQSEVYEVVDREFEQRIQSYADIAAAGDEKMKYLIALRELPVLRFDLSLPSSSTMSNWLTEDKARPHLNSAPVIREAMKFVDKFFSVRQSLASVRLIPALSRFYEILSSVVDGRFTLEELKTITLGQAIEKLKEKKLEAESSIEELEKLVSLFISHSKIFKALVPALDGCDDAARNRAFELEVHELNKDTLLCSLVSQKLGEGFEDTIDRLRVAMINPLVARHNAMLTAREAYQDALAVGQNNEDDEIELDGIFGKYVWNANDTLYQPSGGPQSNVPLAALKYHAGLGLSYDQNFALITGDVGLIQNVEDYTFALRNCDASQIVEQSLCSTVYSRIISFASNDSDDEWHVDWFRVAEHIASLYTGGRRPLLEMPEIAIHEYVPGRSEALAQRANNVVRYIHLDFVSELKKVAEDFRSVLPPHPTFTHDNPRATFKLLRLEVNDLQALCRHLFALLNSFLQRNAPKASQQQQFGSTSASSSSLASSINNTYLVEVGYSIAELERKAGMRELKFPNRDALFSLTGNALYHFANYLVEYHQEYRFWFTEIERQGFETDFDQEAENFIRDDVMGSLERIASDIFGEKDANDDGLLNNNGKNAANDAPRPVLSIAEEIEKRIDEVCLLREAIDSLSTDLAHTNQLKSAASKELSLPLRAFVGGCATATMHPLLVSRLVPSTATLSHFNTFLRKLKVISDFTSSKLDEIKSNDDDNTAGGANKKKINAYQEHVPRHFVDLQQQTQNEVITVREDIIKFDHIDTTPSEFERMVMEKALEARNASSADEEFYDIDEDSNIEETFNNAVEEHKMPDVSWTGLPFRRPDARGDEKIFGMPVHPLPYGQEAQKDEQRIEAPPSSSSSSSIGIGTTTDKAEKSTEKEIPSTPSKLLPTERPTTSTPPSATETSSKPPVVSNAPALMPAAQVVSAPGTPSSESTSTTASVSTSPVHPPLSQSSSSLGMSYAVSPSMSPTPGQGASVSASQISNLATSSSSSAITSTVTINNPLSPMATWVIAEWRARVGFQAKQTVATISAKSGLSKLKRAPNKVFSDDVITFSQNDEDAVKSNFDGKATSLLHLALISGNVNFAHILVQTALNAGSLPQFANQRSEALAHLNNMSTPGQLAIGMLTFARAKLATEPDAQNIMWEILERFNLMLIIAASGQTDDSVYDGFCELCRNQFVAQDRFDSWAIDCAELGTLDPDCKFIWYEE